MARLPRNIQRLFTEETLHEDKAISLTSYQIYQGPGGNGVLLAMPEPSKEERGFRPVEKGSSDEELYQRVCLNKKPAPAAAKAETAKK